MVEHPHGMRFQAFDQAGELLIAERYVSLGGGFIRALDSIETGETVPQHDPMPHPFSTGQQLLDLCEQTGLSIAQLMMANEAVLAPIEQVRQGVLRSEEHTSELQSLMRNSYAVFCFKKKLKKNQKQ